MSQLIREFNPMKDNTDTDIAFQQAIVLGSRKSRSSEQQGKTRPFLKYCAEPENGMGRRNSGFTLWTAAI